MSLLRAFIAVEIPLMSASCLQCNVRFAKGSVPRPLGTDENMHLTLKFLAIFPFQCGYVLANAAC
jgi:2'-5' RNA ligase